MLTKKGENFLCYIVAQDGLLYRKTAISEGLATEKKGRFPCYQFVSDLYLTYNFRRYCKAIYPGVDTLLEDGEAMLQHSFSARTKDRLLGDFAIVRLACSCFSLPVSATPSNKEIVFYIHPQNEIDANVTVGGLVQANSAIVAVHGGSVGNVAASSCSVNIVNDVEAPLGSGANVNIAMGGHESISIL